MAKAVAVFRPARDTKPISHYVPHVLVGLALALIAYNLFVHPMAGFPDEWNIGLRAPLDEFKKWVVGNRATSPIFVFFFEPISNFMDFVIRRAEAFLLWLPWPVLAGFAFLLGSRFGGLRLGIGAALCLLFMGLFGLWDASMQTLALMGAAVTMSLLIGIPLGVWMARSDRVETLVRPILDGMQTMPAFVYLIPVVLFFGIGPVPAAIAAVIYAVPPVVRLTNLGLRRVAEDVIEAADAFGSTPRQMLFKVQIPQALPSILAGVNQTIMMALSIVIIAALVGAGGLGDVVIKSLRRLNVGVALEAGLAIVLLAILLDRLSQAIGQIDYASQARYQEFRLLPARWQQYGWARAIESGIDRVYALFGALGHSLPGPLARHAYWWLALTALLLLGALCFLLGWVDFPKAWYLSLAAPVNAAVKWAQVNLYEIGETGLGTGPFSDFISLYILAPLRKLFTEIIPWPALILLVCAAAWSLAGWGLAVTYAISMIFIGLLGMWDASVDTFTQVLVAVAATVAIGVPLGIWAARNRLVEKIMRPILDFLQTIPSFVYLVPVIMLFNVGRVPGIIASVLYALPPQIRLTVLGIRQVDESAVEAAQAFGSTNMQLLRKVQFPLALPQIMLGVNQAIMMVLSMVIIAGMVGAAGLGLEVVDGMQNNRMGQSVEAGLAIVIVAIMVDRLTQAWARRAEEKANLHV
ncbi:MAG: ABC transporter permease subunit [Caldilinea sp.]|nr:ABC transporter permease subunit [Caldilinea sp.]